MRGWALFVGIGLAACAGASVTSPPGLLSPTGEAPDTISCEHPLAVHAPSDRDGVEAEYDWLFAHYPHHSGVGQMLQMRNGRRYDVLRFRTASGHDALVCFDISDT